MSEKVKTIICYARESTRQQAEDGYNLDTQKKRMEAYIRACFFENVNIEVLEDAGWSARSLNRPKMDEILDRIRNNTVDGLCVYCIDRLSRSVKDFSTLIDLLQKNNVTLLSVQEKIDTSSPQGKLILNLLASVAQFESDNISERVCRALLEAGEQGIYAKAHAPFGYKKNNEKKLEIDEEKAELVRWIFKEIGYKKRSASSVAKELRKNKPFCRQWYDSRIYEIIRSKIYIGIYTVQGIEIPNHSISIVTQQEWNDANMAIAKLYEDHEAKYIYKRYVYCKSCQRLLASVCAYGKSKKIYLYYQCFSCKMRVSQTSLDNQITPIMNKKIQKEKYDLNISNIFKGTTSTYLKTKYCFKELMNNDNIEYVLSIDRVSGRISKETENKVINLLYDLKRVDYSTYSLEEKRIAIEKYVDKIFVNDNKEIERIVFKKR